MSSASCVRALLWGRAEEETTHQSSSRGAERHNSRAGTEVGGKACVLGNHETSRFLQFQQCASDINSSFSTTRLDGRHNYTWERAIPPLVEAAAAASVASVRTPNLQQPQPQRG